MLTWPLSTTFSPRSTRPTLQYERSSLFITRPFITGPFLVWDCCSSEFLFSEDNALKPRKRRHLPPPYNICALQSSTFLDEGRGQSGADEPRTGPADFRSGYAGAVPAGQVHSPACA